MGHGEDSRFLPTLCCHLLRVGGSKGQLRVGLVPRAGGQGGGGGGGSWLLTMLGQRGPREHGELQLALRVPGHPMLTGGEGKGASP